MVYTFVFRFSGEGAWYKYQSQGISSLVAQTHTGANDPSQCCVLLSKLNLYVLNSSCDLDFELWVN